MKHKLQHLIILTSFCLSPLLAVAVEPAVAWGSSDICAELQQNDGLSDISITVEGRQVTVRNAQGKYLEVYDITGKRVYNVHVDSQEMHVSLNLRKGCYILRVGIVTRKVYCS